MDDQRQRLRAMGLDYVNGPPPSGPSQVSPVIYQVNPQTGLVEARPSFGRGVDWFSDSNSQPAPASPVKSGSLDLADGGPGAEKPRAAIGASVTNQINFITLDPVEKKKPGADVRDKRPPGPAVFG